MQYIQAHNLLRHTEIKQKPNLCITGHQEKAGGGRIASTPARRLINVYY